VDVRIVGVELPGRNWGDARPEGACYENIHVGIQRKRDVVAQIPADTVEATWDLEIDVITKDGDLDFRGPFIQGKRGDRFLYLSWGTVADGGFTMFRRAKLMLSAVDASTIRRADRAGHRLVGRLGLTGGDGGPRCAAVRPPAIEWIAVAGETDDRNT
jgi:Family of unknown function (DUF5990)